MVKDFEFKLSALQIEKDKSDDRLRGFEKQREDIIKENNRLRLMASESENLRGDLEREEEKNRELYRKCNRLETELASNSSIEQELTDINMKLKNELMLQTQEIHRSKDQLNRVRSQYGSNRSSFGFYYYYYYFLFSKLKDEYENRFAEWKSKYLLEKNEYKNKCDLLQSKLNKTNKKMVEVAKMHEKVSASHVLSS